MENSSRICKVVLGISFIAIIVICVMVGLSAHKIPEGEIGIYFTGGALQEEFTRPGIHYSNPVMTDVKLIKIRDRTDTLDPLEIITKDGIKTRFDNVQVISGVKPEKVVALVKK